MSEQGLHKTSVKMENPSQEAPANRDSREKYRSDIEQMLLAIDCETHLRRIYKLTHYLYIRR